MTTVAVSRDRIKAGVITAVVQAAIGYALLTGLGFSPARLVPDEFKVFDLAAPRPNEVPPPPPPPPPPPEQRKARPEGGASPPNLRSRATPVVAPKPVVVLPVTPPIAVAERPATGSDATSGNSDIAGPGTGSGGFGDGSGSGRGGYGDGDGGGSPPRLRRGRMSTRDLPDEAVEQDIRGTVSVRYTVWVDGTVRNCRITRSSGSRLLDETTCRLLRERFRFDPARDEQGRPVPADLVENHYWRIPEDDGERNY